MKQPLTDFESAFHTYLSPNHGKLDTKHKNDARKVLEKAIRTYVAAYLAHNPLVTDTDKTALKITIYKTVKTRVPVPKTYPRLRVNISTRQHILVYYRNEGSNHRGKPKGVRGIEICWAILDAPPKTLSQLTHLHFGTKAPLDLEFGESDRGKRVFMCGRWEIARKGIKGPWGCIEEAIVP
ncbi:MAG: hypothetical protein LBJ41_04260 [Treponema sp.]|nr:hypothetical protein [Treponema sp.]